MHPPLFKPHPKCEKVVEELVACHNTKSIAKYFGACNEFKTALDTCFRAEKEERRQLNLQRAREFEQDFKKEEQLRLSKVPNDKS
eukprot:gene23751-30803_t